MDNLIILLFLLISFGCIGILGSILETYIKKRIKEYSKNKKAAKMVPGNLQYEAYDKHGVKRYSSM